MQSVQKIIDGGEFENYDTLEELVREALLVGSKDTSMMDVFSDMDQVLEEDYRHPVPMGIPGIDRLLKGGLAKGEIGVILAPTGVGKSTVLTTILARGICVYSLLIVYTLGSTVLVSAIL